MQGDDIARRFQEAREKLAVVCVKCRRQLDVSLSLFGRREIKVAHCRVSPPGRVFAVGAECAGLASVQQGPCLALGARAVAEAQGMVPAG